MDGYGHHLLHAVTTVCEMLAVGLGLPRDAITSAAEHGSHLLAPTATDLRKHGSKDTIFAGFHSCAAVARDVLTRQGPRLSHDPRPIALPGPQHLGTQQRSTHRGRRAVR